MQATTCGGRKHFRPTEGNRGDCTRYPPTVSLVPRQKRLAGTVELGKRGDFPPVGFDLPGCGEFSPIVIGVNDGKGSTTIPLIRQQSTKADLIGGG